MNGKLLEEVIEEQDLGVIISLYAEWYEMQQSLY